jgi:ParB family chromosome partitioning protein
MDTTAEKVTAEVVEKAAPEKVADKRRALGRGLDSLLPGPRMVTSEPGLAGAAGGAPAPHGPAPHGTVPQGAGPQEGVIAEIHAQAAERAAPGEMVAQIPLDQIESNPYQTRRYFDRESLIELAESIKVSGVVQPIVVRPRANGKYSLILGERRCRASRMAEKTTIPAIVRRVSDQQAAEMTVVENLQRQDLNCMEQAQAFAKLSQEFKLTQGQIGERVGLSRESIANYMRLLKLPKTVQGYMETRALGFTEARELLKLEDNDKIEKITERMLNERWSLARLMDEIEDITIKMGQLPPEKRTGHARWVDPNVRAAARDLERVLGLKVRIHDRKGKGTIRIEYTKLEDFDRVVGMLKGKK